MQLRKLANTTALIITLSSLFTASLGAQELWLANGDHIYNTNPGLVGVGTQNPTASVNFVTNDLFTAGFKGELYATNGNPRFQLATASGTAVSPTPVGSGRQVGSVNYLGYNNGQFLQAARIAAVTETVGAADMPAFLAFYVTGPGTAAASERMRINSAGNIGIGVVSPVGKLHVGGNLRVDGTVTGTNVQAHYQDLAEWVPFSDETAPGPGAVVVLDREKMNTVRLSSEAYDTGVAGVVSAQPGVLLGVPSDEKTMVATTGRVKVRVDATRTPIGVGDLLVTSDVEGVAMRSEPMVINGRKLHQPGTIIGKALEPLSSGTGEILVLLSLQ